MAKKNRTTTQGTDQQVIAGIQKDLSTMSSLPLGSATYTPASLVAFVQSRIDAANEVAVAKANWQNASKTYETLSKQADIVVHDLKQLVIGAFGATSSKLADFGFAPRKVTVQTPEEKAEAAKKRAATRKARNTMGPKAKLAVKGTVPAAAPATPAPAAIPQPTTPTTAPAAAPSTTPPAPPVASAAAPAQAPTVTVNVTTAPATQPVVSPATATAPAPTPTQATAVSAASAATTETPATGTATTKA